MTFSEIDRRNRVDRRTRRTSSQDRDSRAPAVGDASAAAAKPRSSQRRAPRQIDDATEAAAMGHDQKRADDNDDVSPTRALSRGDAATAVASEEDETISAAASPTKHHVTMGGHVAREPTGLEDTPASVGC